MRFLSLNCMNQTSCSFSGYLSLMSFFFFLLQHFSLNPSERNAISLCAPLLHYHSLLSVLPRPKDNKALQKERFFVKWERKRDSCVLLSPEMPRWKLLHALAFWFMSLAAAQPFPPVENLQKELLVCRVTAIKRLQLVWPLKSFKNSKWQH